MKDISGIQSIDWIQPKRCAIMIRWEEHCKNKPRHINSGIEYKNNGNRRIYFWVCCEHYNPTLQEEKLVTVFG